MKVYLFYLIASSFDELVDENGVNADSIEHTEDNIYYTLYAFTNKKYNYKKFKKDRDMCKFLLKIVDMDRLNFEIFCEANVDYLLDIREVKTIDLSKNVITRTSVDILATNIEYDQLYVYGYENFYEILDSVTEVMLGNEQTANLILHALKNKYLYPLTRELLFDVIVPMYPYDDGDFPFVINEFELFIRLFSNTLYMKED